MNNEVWKTPVDSNDQVPVFIVIKAQRCLAVQVPSR